MPSRFISTNNPIEPRFVIITPFHNRTSNSLNLVVCTSIRTALQTNSNWFSCPQTCLLSTDQHWHSIASNQTIHNESYCTRKGNYSPHMVISGQEYAGVWHRLIQAVSSSFILLLLFINGPHFVTDSSQIIPPTRVTLRFAMSRAGKR